MIRELLKPPFRQDGTNIKDSDGTLLVSLWADTSIIAREFNKPDIHKPMKIINEFVLAAITEKWQRDFGGKQWILVMDYGDGIQALKCPDCDNEVMFESCEVSRNFCNKCGSKLKEVTNE